MGRTPSNGTYLVCTLTDKILYASISQMVGLSVVSQHLCQNSTFKFINKRKYQNVLQCHW